jgi:hypothetical protein
MIQLLGLVALAQSELPSVEDVRKHLYEAVRKVRRYRETWLLTTSEPNFQPVTIKRWLDGPRYRQEVQSGGKLLFAAGHDGTFGWFVSHENRQFVERREPNKRFEAPYELGPVPDPGQFKLGFVSPYDLDFRAYPNWIVNRFTDATVGKLPVRRLDATSRRSDTSYINLQLLLDREGWLVTRVVVNGRREEGGRFWQEIRLIDREFGATMDAELFHLEAAKVAGYERLERNPLDDGREATAAVAF